MIRNDKVGVLLDRRREHDERELSRALNEFRSLHQQPDARREWDLQDPDYLKKDKPARVLATPSMLSPDEIAAYQALRSDAVWGEAQGSWSSFRGAKAADALNGLVTNDVASLAPGEGMHAAALTPKGKMITDMLIIRLDESAFLMTVLRSAAPAWLALARKYVNPRLCSVSDESDLFRSWMVYGAP